MKSKENPFKSFLKVNDTPKKENVKQKPNLLEQLGLTNMSDDVSIQLSDDQKYITIQLAPSSENKNPLLFQLPVEETDLSAYYSHPQLEDLSNRYEQYSVDYVDKIKEYSMNESKFLQEKFPNVVFNMKIRMKSKPSYEEKINSAIKKNQSLYPHDIVAERIIVSFVDDSDDPELLTETCYKIAEALYEYRGNTDFRMKDIDISNTTSGKTDKKYLTKDYIENPKENNYQSLHIVMEDITNPDCTYETQIRTFDMEEQSKKDEEIAHSKYKPRLLNDLSTIRVPKYAEVPSCLDEKGNPILYNIPLDQSFYHYYGVPLDSYKKQLSLVEQHVNLKELRKNLREFAKNRREKETQTQTLIKGDD